MPSQFIFGTVGSPKSTPAKPGGSVGAISQIKSLGLGALELGWVQSVRVSEETCNAIRSASLKNQVAVSVHAPYFINLNASDEEWPKSRKRLMDAAHFGNLAGATDIIFHPGSLFGKPRAEVVARATDRLRGCVAELRAAGNPVVLRPETMGKPALFGSLEDALDLSKAIPGVLPCLDFAHLHARTGDGSMNSKDEWRQVINAYAQSLGSRTLTNLHVHLSGIEYGPKGEKEHLKIQDSDFQVSELFLALKEMGCGGRILCESPILEEDALFLQETWLSLST